MAEDTRQTLLAAALILLAATPALALLRPPPPWRISLWLSAAAGALAVIAAGSIVTDGAAVSMRLWSAAPFAPLALRFDPLGGFFAALTAGTAIFASLFGTAYAHPRRTDDATFPLFILSLLLVTSAANVVTFLLGWEAMALTGFFLVMGNGQARPQRVAALLFLAMTHVATVFVAAAFFLIADAVGGRTDFMMMHDAHLSRGTAALAFVAATLGFGTKAGLIPVHIWLPRAHPVAPSHVSALMSAAMVKTGIYGLIRVTFDFLGPGEPWWGIALMGIGTASAVLGILYAQMEQDFKRILAYSTIENIGIITIAIGAALTFRAIGQETLSAAALLAALVHCINHAWIKTLLFLGAGAVQHVVHTLAIDRGGGLLRQMPITGSALLVGSFAIAALPPFNGFVGEWLLLRSLIHLGGATGHPISALAGLTALGGLALTSGLAVAAFVRLFGTMFLGLPRSPEAARAHEPSVAMWVILATLAIGCFVLGIAGAVIVDWLRPVATSLLGSAGVVTEDEHRLVLTDGGSLSPAVLVGVLIVLAPLPWILARLAFGPNRRSTGPTWATGVPFQASMQYSGAGFAKPIRLFFRRILLPERNIDVAYHGSSPFPRLVQYSGRIPALFEERFYLPLRALSMQTAARLRLLQSGSVQAYLLYMLAALVILLLVAR